MEEGLQFTNHKTKYKNTPRGRVVTLLQGARRRAKEEGLEFDIGVNDIVIPIKCKYLLTDLTFDGSNSDTSASLDRISSSIGYIKGNVQIISAKANRMKSDATDIELLTFAVSILKDSDLWLYPTPENPMKFCG